jgi:hypothetical protein
MGHSAMIACFGLLAQPPNFHHISILKAFQLHFGNSNRVNLGKSGDNGIFASFAECIFLSVN